LVSNPAPVQQHERRRQLADDQRATQVILWRGMCRSRASAGECRRKITSAGVQRGTRAEGESVTTETAKVKRSTAPSARMFSMFVIG
jgi:hypothetical protein